MKKHVDLAVITDQGDIVASCFMLDNIICVYEDSGNPKRAFIVMSSGQGVHIDLDYESLRKMIISDN